MAYTFTLLAPSSTTGFVFTNSVTGNSYTSDGFGYIKNVASNDVTAGLLIGCEVIGAAQAANNVTATTDPAPTNDNTQDYGVGSLWVNTTAGRPWLATGVGTGAAVWRQASQNESDFRNLLDGGDFTINPWQRGTSFTGIAGTVTYTADRWFAVGNASSAINVAQSSISSVPGFQYGALFTRASSNSSTVAIYFGQVLETADCYRAQGQQVTLSFWAQAGANFSAASSKLSVQLNEGFSSNQSASSMMASSWTTQSSLIASSVVLVSSGFTRYQLTATVSSGATQLGVQLGFAGVSSAGAVDGFIIAGVQLEIGASASEFEHRDIQVELEIAQRYAWYLAEPSSGVAVASGVNTSSAAQTYFLPLPVQMRIAPTLTVSSGSWKTTQASSTSSGTISSGTTHTTNGLTITCNATGTGGQATLLVGGGGTGWILASADL